MSFSEIGSDNYERRKVGQYRDGRLDFADASRTTGTTQLGDQQMLPLAQINADGEFTGEAIDADAFEEVWKRARRRLS